MLMFHFTLTEVALCNSVRLDGVNLRCSRRPSFDSADDEEEEEEEYEEEIGGSDNEALGTTSGFEDKKGNVEIKSSIKVVTSCECTSTSLS